PATRSTSAFTSASSCAVSRSYSHDPQYAAFPTRRSSDLPARDRRQGVDVARREGDDARAAKLLAHERRRQAVQRPGARLLAGGRSEEHPSELQFTVPSRMPCTPWPKSARAA